MIIVTAVSFGASAQISESASLQERLQQAEKALAEQRYSDAAGIYESLRQSNPGIAEVHARLGLIYFQQGKFEQAAPALKQALKLKPTLAKTDILLAMSLCELGQYREALGGLQKGFEQTADRPLRRMAGLQLQRAYTGLKQDAKAVEIALQMSTHFPNDPEVLYHAGKLFGNFAYLTMRTLSDVAPESVWTNQAIGEAQESQGQYDLAILRYKQVIAIAPQRPGIHYRLGRSYVLRAQHKGDPGDVAAAMEAFERELSIDPTNANAAYELGVLHYRAAEYDKAHTRFAGALKHSRDFQEAEVGIARALLALNRTAEAVPHLRKAIGMNAKDEVAHYQLSRAYQKLGNAAGSQEAMKEFQRLRQERSDEQAVQLNRAVTRQEVDSDPAK